jgi:hypothetical protein
VLDRSDSRTDQLVFRLVGRPPVTQTLTGAFVVAGLLIAATTKRSPNSQEECNEPSNKRSYSYPRLKSSKKFL